MKSIIILLLSVSASMAQFAVGTMRIQTAITVGPPSTFTMASFGTPPGSSANFLMGWNGTAAAPSQMLLGSNFSWDSSTKVLDIVGTQADIPAGTTSQYYRGDKTWASWINADWNAVSGGAQIQNKPTLGTAAAQNTSAFATAAQGTTADSALQPSGNGSSLTGLTQGQISGLTAALAGKFPNPSGTTAQYLRGDGTLATFPAITSGTVTSVGLSSTDFSISGSPITTSGSITANLGTVGTAGTYSGVTTDSKGRVTAGTTRSFNNTATKTLVTSPTGQGGVVLDVSRDTAVTYSISTSTTATIGGAASVTAYIEIASTNSATAGDWTAIQTTATSQTITLAVVLQSVQANTLTLSGIIPAGQYMRIRYAVTGTASAAYVNGQEVKL